MTAGMAEVIAAHTGSYEWSVDLAELHAYCHCGWRVSSSGEPIHATHVAEELAKAGYGNVADAWDEGATAGWRQSGEGFNAEYPDESTGECSVDLSANPHRESPHGVD